MYKNRESKCRELTLIEAKGYCQVQSIEVVPSGVDSNFEINSANKLLIGRQWRLARRVP